MGYAYIAKVADTVTPEIPDDWPPDWTYPDPDDLIIDPPFTPDPSSPNWGDITTPPGGGDPGIVWPPGWPVVIPPIDPSIPTVIPYTMTVDADSTFVYGGSATVEARVLNLGIDTSDLEFHLIGMYAVMDGAIIQISEDGVTFTDTLWFKVTNYSGSKYGMLEEIFPNTEGADVGKIIAFYLAIITVSPIISASDTTLVAANVNVKVGYYSTNLQNWTASSGLDSNTIPASQFNQNGWISLKNSSKGIYISTDNAVTFSLKTTWTPNKFADNQRRPTNSNTILIAVYAFPSFEIWRSSDSGNTWSTVLSSATGMFDSFVGLQPLGNHTWIFIAKPDITTLVYRSTDDGVTWSSSSDLTSPGNCLVGANNRDGYLTVAGGTFQNKTYNTINRGSSWYLSNTTAPAGHTWRGANCVDTNGRWTFSTITSSGTGNIYYSNDYGLTWNLSNYAAPNRYVNGTFFVNESLGILCCNSNEVSAANNKVLVSTDWGATWSDTGERGFATCWQNKIVVGNGSTTLRISNTSISSWTTVVEDSPNTLAVPIIGVNPEVELR